MDLPQAYFLLKSLKENLPEWPQVAPKWVDDFHAILDAVEEETDVDLSAFRVPEGDVYHPVVSVRRASRHGPGQVRRSSKTAIDRTRLLHKVDAVLAYFQFSQGAGDTPKQSIGFKK